MHIPSEKNSFRQPIRSTEAAGTGPDAASDRLGAIPAAPEQGEAKVDRDDLRKKLQAMVDEVLSRRITERASMSEDPSRQSSPLGKSLEP